MLLLMGAQGSHGSCVQQFRCCKQLLQGMRVVNRGGDIGETSKDCSVRSRYVDGNGRRFGGLRGERFIDQTIEKPWGGVEQVLKMGEFGE